MDSLLNSGDEAAKVASQLWEMTVAYAPKLTLALLTLIFGWWIIGRIVGGVTGSLEKRTDPTLVRFMHSLVGIGLKAMLIIAVAGMVGVETTSFIAVLGAAGLAVGLALQGSLANFAGGVLILIFKPYRIGDFIEAQGYMGVVKEIQIFNTIITTGDNRVVIIPNGALSNGSLINYSAEKTRRVDMSFGVDYSSDLKKVKEVLQRVAAEDKRVLKTPEPTIAVHALADSSVNFVYRVWVNTPEYWNVYFDTQQKVKETFDQEGISIPFPHRVVVQASK